MTDKMRLLVCVAGAALCCAAVEAKEVKLRRGERGLYNVVDHACSTPLWLSEAMRLTPLDSSRLTKLKVGDRVVVPDICTHRRPPAEVIEATLRLFKGQQVFERVQQQQENSGGNVVQGIIVERDSAKREAVSMKEEKQQLEWKLKIADADRDMSNREVVTLKEGKRQLDGKLKIAGADLNSARREVVTLKEEKRQLAHDLAVAKANAELARKKGGSNSAWWFAVVGGIIVGNILMFAAVWLLVVRKLRADAAAVELVLLRAREEKATAELEARLAREEKAALELEIRLPREENQFLLAEVASLNEDLRVAREEEEKRLRVRLSAFASGEERADRSIVFFGKVVKFRDTSDYTVACPYCPRATKIRANAYQMESHLLNAHRELLLEERPPEEMERKMAGCR
jgi:hypothetical protein